MAKRVYRYVTPELRKEVLRLSARGLTSREIEREIGLSKSMVCLVVRVAGGVCRADMFDAPCGRLTFDDRIEIYVGRRCGLSMAAIARDLGVHPSTVSREIARHGGDKYKPLAAHRAAEQNRRRPKPCKLAAVELAEEVTAMLKDLLSPEQIMGRLRVKFPDRPEMWVSHETIYKSLYVQGRGQLRRELAACLRTGRAVRRPHGTSERRARIADMVNISERPADVADRAVVGDWEGDLILGEDGKSAIGTLVERKTRFLLLLHLPGRHDALSVRNEMTRVMKTLPDALRRSLTWDQGSEMAQHVQFSIDAEIDVYFCDPHSPWQRGTNENTNGLLRQYFPKGTDLSIYSRADLDRVEASMNRRPRKTLGFMTPSEALAPLLAPTG